MGSGEEVKIHNNLLDGKLTTVEHSDLPSDRRSTKLRQGQPGALISDVAGSEHREEMLQ